MNLSEFLKSLREKKQKDMDKKVRQKGQTRQTKTHKEKQWDRRRQTESQQMYRDTLTDKDFEWQREEKDRWSADRQWQTDGKLLDGD